MYHGTTSLGFSRGNPGTLATLPWDFFGSVLLLNSYGIGNRKLCLVHFTFEGNRPLRTEHINLLHLLHHMNNLRRILWFQRIAWIVCEEMAGYFILWPYDLAGDADCCCFGMHPSHESLKINELNNTIKTSCQINQHLSEHVFFPVKMNDFITKTWRLHQANCHPKIWKASNWTMKCRSRRNWLDNS